MLAKHRVFTLGDNCADQPTWVFHDPPLWRDALHTSLARTTAIQPLWSVATPSRRRRGSRPGAAPAANMTARSPSTRGFGGRRDRPRPARANALGQLRPSLAAGRPVSLLVSHAQADALEAGQQPSAAEQDPADDIGQIMQDLNRKHSLREPTYWRPARHASTRQMGSSVQHAQVGQASARGRLGWRRGCCAYSAQHSLSANGRTGRAPKGLLRCRADPAGCDR
jgi:hypothetical protein